MNEFEIKLKEFFDEFDIAKKMVLSTSMNNIVSSRMVSIVCFDNKFYFQTDINFRKYEQIIQNPNVSLCIDNIQIEGVAKCLGKPLDNEKFIAIFKEKYPGSFNAYSSLNDEILFEIEPKYIEKWLYLEGFPYMEIFDFRNRKYSLEKYLGK